MSTETKSLHDMQADLVAPRAPASVQAPRSADQQITDDQHKREKGRRQRRAAVRQQIKEREKLMQQVADLEAQLKLLDAKADSLAADHEAKTKPIQEALAGATGTKRAALLERLTAANIELEQALDVVNRCRGPLTRQHRETRSEAAKLPTANRLAGEDLAASELRAELFAAQSRLEVAEQRVARATEWVGTYREQLQLASSVPTRPVQYGWTEERGKISLDFERIALLSHRLRKWQCELTHASQEADAAQRAIAEIAAAMIAE